MKPASRTTLVIALLFASTASAQSFVPPPSASNNYPQQGFTEPYTNRWQDVGSGYNYLGLETTPHSLDLRFPRSTGVPSVTHGYRPPPFRPYVSPFSAMMPSQDTFGLPGSTPLPKTSGPYAFGGNRFLESYLPERNPSPVIRSQATPYAPAAPSAAYPITPLPPLGYQTPSQSIYGEPATGTATPGDQTLALPALPWEKPQQALAEPEPGSLGPPSQIKLPPIETGIAPSPTELSSPLNQIMQRPPYEPIAPSLVAPQGSLRQPLGAQQQPENPAAAQPMVTTQLPAGVRASQQPLLTAAGVENAATKKYLDKAVLQLKEGDYIRAAESYDLARILAPKNPVPLLGRTVALLASGDLMSAANNLILAVNLEPSPQVFRQDIKAMLSDHKLLEQRINEMQESLKRFDDFRLRFLLGYVEYCTGDETAGIIDMTQAVQKFPAERPAARNLVETLRKERLRQPRPSTAPAATK